MARELPKSSHRSERANRQSIPFQTFELQLCYVDIPIDSNTLIGIRQNRTKGYVMVVDNNAAPFEHTSRVAMLRV